MMSRRPCPRLRPVYPIRTARTIVPKKMKKIDAIHDVYTMHSMIYDVRDGKDTLLRQAGDLAFLGQSAGCRSRCRDRRRAEFEGSDDSFNLLLERNRRVLGGVSLDEEAFAPTEDDQVEIDVDAHVVLGRG